MKMCFLTALSAHGASDLLTGRSDEPLSVEEKGQKRVARGLQRREKIKANRIKKGKVQELVMEKAAPSWTSLRPSIRAADDCRSLVRIVL